MTSPSHAERRRYPRVAGRLKLRVSKAEQQIVAETVNVSCGGTLCWLSRPLPLMTKVSVALALPRRLVQCTGVVVRCTPARQPTRARGQYQAAMFFMDMSREDHRAIAEFVLESMFQCSHDHRRP